MQSSRAEETRFYPGSLRELLSLAFPLFLMLVSAGLLGFLERVWFSHLSVTTWEASLHAVYVLKLLQAPCVCLVLMGHSFVGYYFGAQKHSAIGPCIWQLVWFSLFTTVLTIPLSFVVHRLCIRGTEIEEAVTVYFFMLAFCNFLLPCASALAGFYLGRGKARLVTVATLLMILLNAGLDVILIGKFGLVGAAWAMMISQGLFCVYLLFLFLSSSNQQLYATHQWQFQPRLFWHYISSAIPRALGRFVMMIIWTAMIQIMALKGGSYLLILSIGGTIRLFTDVWGDGLLQSLTVLISNACGRRDDLYIKNIVRSSVIFVAILEAILVIPLVIFPHYLLSLFSLAPTESLINTLFWVWFSGMLYNFSVIPASFLLAYKETLIFLIATLGTWITGYLPVYLGINTFHWTPDKFWLLVSSCTVVASGLYIWQIIRKRWLYPSLNTQS